jgi:hypothetical protein
MRAKIEIEAKTIPELAELLTRLAAHLLRTNKTSPIKILDASGATVASLAIEDEADGNQP